jgi:hypothetical protein
LLSITTHLLPDVSVVVMLLIVGFEIFAAESYFIRRFGKRH